MSRKTVTGILAADVATGGTFTVGYPSGYDRGSFSTGFRHKLSAIGRVFNAPEDMTLNFGAANATVTYNGATTLVAGTKFTFEFDIPGEVNPTVEAVSGANIYTAAKLAVLHLGSPSASGATNIAAAQAIAGAVALALNGTLVVNGVGVIDARTGRNVVAVSSNAGDTTQSITVTGTDMYGVAMHETIALNGTVTVAGKKAFKKITGIVASAALAGNISVGTGNVLGLPSYLLSAGYVLKELQDGAAAVAGTFVAGLAMSTKPAATTADVRGTYTPNAAPDGSKAYSIIASLNNPAFLGATQF